MPSKPLTKSLVWVIMEAVPQGQIKNNGEMRMYCKNCGEHMNDNQAICLKCGVETGKGDSFCQNCGAAVNPGQAVCLNWGVAINQNQNQNQKTVNPMAANIKPRSIVTAIILSIVTCGIYGIYWFVCLTNELNILSGHDQDTSGGMCFLLGLVTCGIYTYYWAYKMGEKRDELAGNPGGSSGILYLVLMLLGVGIVDYALIQDTINKSI